MMVVPGWMIMGIWTSSRPARGQKEEDMEKGRCKGCGSSAHPGLTEWWCTACEWRALLPIGADPRHDHDRNDGRGPMGCDGL